MLGSVLRVIKKYYLQILLEECKYEICSSDDETDSESDNETDNEFNNE